MLEHVELSKCPLAGPKQSEEWQLPSSHGQCYTQHTMLKGLWGVQGSVETFRKFPLSLCISLAMQGTADVTALFPPGVPDCPLQGCVLEILTLKCNHWYQGIACSRLITTSWLWDPRHQWRNWLVNLEERKGTWMMCWWLHLITKPMPFT